MRGKRIPYKVFEIDLQNKPAGFLKVSRYGKVPCLIDGEHVIHESADINEYLDERFPEPVLKSPVTVLLERGDTLIVPGVYDVLGARIAERCGFEVLFISGYSIAATTLGRPDFGFVTLTEMAEAARRVCGAAGRPVIVDADTGYGNPLNVRRTVRELLRAGAAGMFLEDQVWPKRCGHMRGKQVVPLDEYLGKLEAAQEERGDAPFFIVARTDAREASGLDEAIERGKAFRRAGADAVFIEAPQSVEEMRRIAGEIEGFLVANMLEGGVTPILDRSELKPLGFHFVVFPLTGLYATARSLAIVFKALREEGSTRSVLDRLASFDEFHDLVDLASYYELEKRYRS